MPKGPPRRLGLGSEGTPTEATQPVNVQTRHGRPPQPRGRVTAGRRGLGTEATCRDAAPRPRLVTQRRRGGGTPLAIHGTWRGRSGRAASRRTWAVSRHLRPTAQETSLGPTARSREWPHVGVEDLEGLADGLHVERRRVEVEVLDRARVVVAAPHALVREVLLPQDLLQRQAAGGPTIQPSPFSEPSLFNKP